MIGDALDKDIRFAFDQHVAAMLALREAEANAQKTRETLESMKRLRAIVEVANDAVEAVEAVDVHLAVHPEAVAVVPVAVVPAAVVPANIDDSGDYVHPVPAASVVSAPEPDTHEPTMADF